MNAREIAYKVLLDIEKNNNYSNMAINKHFKDVKLSNQDRGLATEIIYGVIENKYCFFLYLKELCMLFLLRSYFSPYFQNLINF